MRESIGGDFFKGGVGVLASAFRDCAIITLGGGGGLENEWNIPQY